MKIRADQITNFTLAFDPARPGMDGVSIAEHFPDGRIEVRGEMKVMVWDLEVLAELNRAFYRRTLEARLRARHVREDIIERVLRLNPDDRPGCRLRGIHYKARGRFLPHMDAASKGEVIRRYGRWVWEAIPRSEHRKQGRRIFVTRLAVMRAIARG